jgi:glyoxylase-like metal-dependent hydrolase (beta-lactamase superfamily II)
VPLVHHPRARAGPAWGAPGPPHAWWAADGPADDPLATEPAALAASRDRILAVATVVIPGHGPAFRPDASTPR